MHSPLLLPALAPIPMPIPPLGLGFPTPAAAAAAAAAALLCHRRSNGNRRRGDRDKGGDAIPALHTAMCRLVLAGVWGGGTRTHSGLMAASNARPPPGAAGAAGAGAGAGAAREGDGAAPPFSSICCC